MHRPVIKDKKNCNNHSPPTLPQHTLFFWQKIPFLDKKRPTTDYDPKVSVHHLDKVKVYKKVKH